MKLQAARPYQIRSVVDHVGLVFATVGSGTASVASIDIAERWPALFVAVVLEDMKLFIVISACLPSISSCMSKTKTSPPSNPLRSFFSPLHVFRADLSWNKFGIRHHFNNSIGSSSRKGIHIPQPNAPRLRIIKNGAGIRKEGVGTNLPREVGANWYSN